jgi:hypothetical protein
MSNAPMTNVRPLLMPVPRARAELGNIGNTKMWELIGEGEPETVSIGRRRFVVVESLDAYIARLRARAAERREGRPQQTEMHPSKAARAAPAYAGSDPRIDDGDRRAETTRDERRAVAAAKLRLRRASPRLSQPWLTRRVDERLPQNRRRSPRGALRGLVRDHVGNFAWFLRQGASIF